jgi:hypothetical protein
VFYRRILVVTALLTAACSSKPELSPPRYAVLRFENLTPDPSLNWIGRAASNILIHEIGAISSSLISRNNEVLGGRPVAAPGVSSELSAALLAGANRIITGYVEQINGKLSFTAVEEDARTGRTLRSATAQGALFDACATLSRQFTASPKPYPTQNETAMRDLTQGIEKGGESGKLYEAAVAADPKFPEAYLAWSEDAVAHKDSAAIARILAEARANKIGEAPIAKLELAAALLNKDPEARTSALKRIVETDPQDLQAIEGLGNSEFAAHHFTAAAAAFGKGASEIRPDLFNLKAYALMFGGDEPGALAAVHEYQKARPQDANAIDTEGDIEFFFGHFAEAERFYLLSVAKDPQFNQGAGTWKAARARLMTGDVAGATRLFNTFQQAREKARDIAVPFRAAQWQFITGDRTGGIEAMRKAANSTNPALKTLALAQAAIWELELDRKADAIRDSEAVLRAGQNPNIVAAAIVRFSATDAAGATELRARAEKVFSGPSGEQLRPAAVAYSLFFAKRYGEAAPLWKQIYDESGPNDQSSAFLYAGALKESGRGAEAAPLLKGNPLPSANLNPGFESLYFPKLFDWRGDRVTYLKLSGNTATPSK